MKIRQSAEDYLEAILRLREEKGYARSIDIAMSLGITKPSVSVAMKRLRENGYINMDENNYITLTDEGNRIAQRIYHRHKTLSKLLIQLGVDPEIAQEDACRVEHVISEETFEAILKSIQ
ncbi:MAG: metal-dependent transcriptional regulator [Clostridia bacterium]|nr:metal-dependent transcriptional regulator [Clostridia bacterium]